MRTQAKLDEVPVGTGRVRPATTLLARGILLGLVGVGVFMQSAAAQNIFPLGQMDSGARQHDRSSALTAVEAPSESGQLVRLANFGQEAASPESRNLADWVVDSANNNKLPFIVIDKVQARVFVFDAQGQLRGAAPALLGAAIGDDSVPGIGERPLSSIRPEERTTAAGRFVASLDRDAHGKELLWVDYDSALSLHPVVPGHPKERRAERLATPTPLDNRISFGCINVPVKFYKDVVSPAFTKSNGIVYILPETRSSREVFGSYDVQDPSRQHVSAQAAQASHPAAR